GWQLDSATCTGGSDSLTDETLSVAVGVGEDVACTFTNVDCPAPLAILDETELANCITLANVNSGADLGLGADVTLSAALPTIDTAITLNGNGHYVDGNNGVRVFEVTTAGNFSVDNITIQNGSTSWGGGIYNDGTLTVTNSALSGNVATSGGGGIYIGGGGTLNVTNGTFSGNSANNGGGIVSYGGTLTVANSTFSSNSSTDSGGGISSDESLVTVTNSTFSGNSADNDGGGILNSAGTTLKMTNSTFSGNWASRGGGIFDLGYGWVTLTNSTFYSNSATLDGGAIYKDDDTEVNLAGNIFSGSAQCSGTMTDNGYNLSSDDSCSFDESLADGSADNATLNLGALSGGVHTPGAGSDAIGVIPNGTTITNNTVSWTCNQSGFTDQLGSSRPIVTGDACTSGAVEVVPLPICDISNASITKMGATTAQLSWTNSGDPAAEYRLFWSSSPYSGYAHLDETVSGTSHNVTIDPLQNYYYEVRGYADAGDADGDYSCKSGEFGVFSFGIVPGS
ncbi:MAG: hypothetical protein GY764_08245, partial [Halieaceae bacterium]|nr:hypothetical protein [Halieaceae bacterium]